MLSVTSNVLCNYMLQIHTRHVVCATQNNLGSEFMIGSV